MNIKIATINKQQRKKEKKEGRKERKTKSLIIKVKVYEKSKLNSNVLQFRVKIRYLKKCGKFYLEFEMVVKRSDLCELKRIETGFYLIYIGLI